MPELPEVETIVTNLKIGTPDQPSLIGMAIVSSQVLWARSLATPTCDKFIERLPGQLVEDIWRRGKYLVFKLSNDYLLFHLRMSGDLLVGPQDAPIAAHDRLLMDFQDGYRLTFNDTRKFGRVWLVPDVDIVLSGLGPEPLDESFSAIDLYQRLQRHHRQIKPLLQDQKFLAGLGNIYADEALHLAGLHPLIISSRVTQDQAAKLWLSVRQVLQDGILHNGASIDWVYRGGDFQNHFRVYQRTGEPCLNCGTPIEKIVVGQRGTHFCPQCQPQLA